jgi:hypothetical protein
MAGRSLLANGREGALVVRCPPRVAGATPRPMSGDGDLAGQGDAVSDAKVQWMPDESGKHQEATMRVRFNQGRFLFGGVALGCAWLLASCASTQMTSVWRDSQYTGGPLKKIAIIVVNKDDLARRMVEDETARSLSGGKTQVVPSYTVIEKLVKDETAIKNTLLANGFDGVLVGRLTAFVENKTYQPPATATYVTFAGYYGAAYNVEYAPGYTRVDTRAVVETVLYKLPEAKPIWKGTTESMNPNSRGEVVEKIGQLIGKELRSGKLIDAP